MTEAVRSRERRLGLVRRLATGATGLSLLVATLSGSGAEPARASYPGAPGKVVWVQGSVGGPNAIWSADPDGTNAVQLTQTPGAYDRPTVSPTGEHIAFERGTEILVMSIDGTDPERVSPEGTSRRNPTWSPDGTKLAYDDGNGLFTLDLESRTESILRASQEATGDCTRTLRYVRPRWSPKDGELVAVRLTSPPPSDCDGQTPQRDLVLVATATGDVTVLTDDEELDDFPDWSPQGTAIVFQRGVPSTGYFGIARISPSAGAAVTQILTGSGAQPRFSPNGSRILYTRFSQNGKFELWTVTASGGNPTRFVEAAQGSFSPDWGPLPTCGLEASGASATLARAGQTTAVDSDCDGLSDRDEKQKSRTDPRKKDTDGDGLLDPWEVNPSIKGSGFDTDGDGKADTPSSAVLGPFAGAPGTSSQEFGNGRLAPHYAVYNGRPNPLHKDVYFEMDWQDCLGGGCPEGLGLRVDPVHHAPDPQAIGDLRRMFREAPVENPDKVPGITLHVLVDEAMPHVPNCARAGDNVRGFFGTELQRGAREADEILSAKAKAVRYIWSGHSSADLPSCPSPNPATFFLQGRGDLPLPAYDFTPFGSVDIGGSDVLITTSVLWHCPAVFQVCFRGAGLGAGVQLGIFPARIAGQGDTLFRRPISRWIGIPDDSEVKQQIWGRALAHLVGNSLGLDDVSVGNKPGVLGLDRNGDGRVDARRPVDPYTSWAGVHYGPAHGHSHGSAGHAPNYDEIVDQDPDNDDIPSRRDFCPYRPSAGNADLDLDDVGDVCDADIDGDGLENPAISSREALARMAVDDPYPYDTDNDAVDNDEDEDDDQDAVSDEVDVCPLRPDPGQSDVDSDGRGDVCDEDDDGDGFSDGAESDLGSDPLEAGALPELLGLDSACSDGVDDDGDGAVDDADPGCRDSDGDATPNLLDHCPTVSNPMLMPPTLSVGAADRAEGDRGRRNMTFKVTLTCRWSKTVTVRYETRNVTAKAGVDFRAVSGTLRLTPGTTKGVIRVPVIGDTKREPDEYFILALSRSKNAPTVDGEAYGRIRNDDA